MKNCKCGQMIASNARVCPHCGNRFTHPFVNILAWFFGISIAIALISAMFLGSQKQTAATNPTSASVPVLGTKTAQDEAAWAIKHCGQPDREFTEKTSGAAIRHLVYRKFSTELFFYRDAEKPHWRLGNAFIPNRDEDMTMEEANRRMPCAKGQLHSLLESK
jgi:hypothetical protein